MLTKSLCSAIIVGASQTAFSLPTVVINTLVIDPEIFLVFLGVFNKILDYLVNDALIHICETKLTTWMLQDAQKNATAGIVPNDFKLKDELTLPWVPLSHIPSQLYSWKKTTGYAALRTFLTLASSICVLLLGAGINTVGIPKNRWHPAVWDPDYLNARNVTSSKRALQNVNWMNYWNEAFDSIGGGATSWAIANALSSSTPFAALGQVLSIHAQEPSGWHTNSNLLTSTALDTRMTGSIAYSVSALGDACLADIYAEFKESGSSYARASSGIDGTANMTLPFLTTTCIETQQNTSDMLVSMSNFGQLIVFLPSMLNNSTLKCSLDYQQTLFPVNFWFGGTTDDGDYHANLEITPNTIALPRSPTDEMIVENLQIQITGMKPYLDAISPSSSFVQYMWLVAQNLQKRTANITTPNAAMTSVVAFTFQHILTMGAWNVTRTEEQVPNSLSFFVYGSGPRTAWEWAAVLILIVPLMACCYDIYLILWRSTTRGPWLDAAGMMLTANASEPFSKAVANCSGFVKSKATSFFIRDVGAGRVEVTEDSAKGSVLKPGIAYSD